MATTKKAATPKAKAAIKVKPLTKDELITRIQSKVDGDTTKTLVGGFLNALADIASEELCRKGQFNVAGLGRFKVKVKPATKERKGINPKTGEELTIAAKPAHSVVRVTAASELRNAVAVG